MTEQRQYQRIKFATSTELELGGRQHQAALVDISLKGALVQLPATLLTERGIPCRLRISLSDPEVVLSFEGEVVHARDELIGLKFTRFNLESITHLRRLLELNSANPERVLDELHALIAPE